MVGGVTGDHGAVAVLIVSEMGSELKLDIVTRRVTI